MLTSLAIALAFIAASLAIIATAGIVPYIAIYAVALVIVIVRDPSGLAR